MLKILVTGCKPHGFIGNATAMALEKNGYDVRRANYDFTDIGEDFDILCHFAAIVDTTVTDERLMFGVNFEKSKELFTKAVEYGCKKIVYASSCAVYGDIKGAFKENGKTKPLNCYAESKLALDDWVENFDKCPIIGLRYSNVFGPGERTKGRSASVVSQLLWQMQKGLRPKLFKYGEQRRDWVYIEDVVQANLAAISCEQSGIYNIGSGFSTSFNEVLKVWNEVLGTDFSPEYIENPYDKSYQSITEVNISKAKTILDYRPRSFYDGIRSYLEGING